MIYICECENEDYTTDEHGISYCNKCKHETETLKPPKKEKCPNSSEFCISKSYCEKKGFCIRCD